MARLYRPHVPIAVRVTVALGQLNVSPIDASNLLERYWRRHGMLLETLLVGLAGKMGCAVEELRLDHDPPLGARPKERQGLGRKTYYIPDANDPAHLFYRPHGPEHEGSHLIKTNVRGDHGQYSDLALIKRERRRSRKRSRPKQKIAARKKPWPKRAFPKRRKS